MTTENHEEIPMRSTCCPCGHDRSSGDITRRGFLQGVGGAAALGVALTGLTWSAVSAAEKNSEDGPMRRPLVVKPILVYSTPRPRPQTSWRSWGGIQTEQDAEQEIGRIRRELTDLGDKADFPVEFLAPAAIKGAGELPGLNDLSKADVFLIYAAGGGMDTFAKLAEQGKDIIFFCRHKSGPVYLWYEIISPRYLRQHTDKLALRGIDDGDVVIDSQDEILWRLRALCGLRNTMGTKILAIGGPGAWAQPRGVVPKLVEDKWKFEMKTVPYDELGKLNQSCKGGRRSSPTRPRTRSRVSESTGQHTGNRASLSRQCVPSRTGLPGADGEGELYGYNRQQLYGDDNAHRRNVGLHDAEPAQRCGVHGVLRVRLCCDSVGRSDGQHLRQAHVP